MRRLNFYADLCPCGRGILMSKCCLTHRVNTVPKPAEDAGVRPTRRPAAVRIQSDGGPKELHLGWQPPGGPIVTVRQQQSH